MDTWLIVVLVVVAVALIALLVVALSKRSRISRARAREQARDQLQEAQIRSARADTEQARAEEQAAAARREMAEVQERAALAEKEARALSARADEDRSAAEELRARARKAAPDLVHDGTSNGAAGSAGGRHAAQAGSSQRPEVQGHEGGADAVRSDGARSHAEPHVAPGQDGTRSAPTDQPDAGGATRR